MISVLDAPMASDGLGGVFRADGHGADIKGGFLSAVPQSVLCSAHEGRSGDADDARDEAVPYGVFKHGAGIEDLDGSGLGAHAFVQVDGFMAPQWPINFGGGLDFPHQGGLIFLNLDKKMTFRLAGRAKSFFDSAWRPA